MGAHRGRCFRSIRRTVKRKYEQGEEYDPFPMRWKVPAAIAPFLQGVKGQSRARHDQMGEAIARYAQHHKLTGKGAPVRAVGQARGS